MYFMLNQIENRQGLKYTESYSNYGKTIMQNFDNEWLEHIVKELQQDYIGLDIGSCDGYFSKCIQSRAIELGKTGYIVAIDPFPVIPEVISIKGEDYCKHCTPETFDFIICKYMIHFVEDIRTFLENMKKILRPNGKIYLMTLMPTSSFPWTEKIQDSFTHSCMDLKQLEMNLSDCFPDTWKRCIHISKQSIKSKENQEQFTQLLRGRGFSNLIQFDDSDIQQSIQSFYELCKTNPEDCMIHLEVVFYECVKIDDIK